jgi:RNA polymerase sigma-70 factor (ECF subfamily)
LSPLRGPEASAHDPEASAHGREKHALGEVRQLDVERLGDHRDRLFRAACGLCRSRDEAEDLVQETYARVLRRPRFLRNDDDLGYLLKVMRNTWINAYKSRARRPETVEFDEATDFVIDPGTDPGVSVVELQSIYAAVRQLSPPLRETLAAVDIGGLSYRQAARALGTRQGTIMSRLHRARSQVARALAETGAVELREDQKSPDALGE